MKMRRAPEDERPPSRCNLDDLEDKLPPPLPSFYSVTDDAKEATPIFTLFHGDYLNR
jgi:hypothetical protein